MFRPGIWAYLARRAELTYLRECDRLLHSQRMAVVERLKPGAVMTEFWIRVLPENLDGAETLAIP